jgi:hypothetical protein
MLLRYRRSEIICIAFLECFCCCPPTSIDFGLAGLCPCSSTHPSLVRWSARLNKRSELFPTRSEDQRKPSFIQIRKGFFGFDEQTGPVYDCVKPLPQRATKEASLWLREVSTSMSKPLSQCDDLFTSPNLNSEPASMAPTVNAMTHLLIALPTSEPVLLSVHVQLVSLLQWHTHRQSDDPPPHRPTYQWTGPPTSSRATSEPATMAR